MRSLSRIIVIALAALFLLPAAGRAQDVIIEPPMPPDCPGCWWPVTEMAQLDGIEAGIEVNDGVSIARYRFDSRTRQSPAAVAQAPRAASSSRSRPAAR